MGSEGKMSEPVAAGREDLSFAQGCGGPSAATSYPSRLAFCIKSQKYNLEV